MGREGPARGQPAATFWAGLVGVLAGLLAAGLLAWVLQRPAPALPLTLQPPPTPRPWLVQVAGAVQQPGVYEVPPHARVADAIAVAGGLAPEADADQVNLAAPLEDGAWVWIPARGTPTPPEPTPLAAPTSPVPPSHRVDLNTATAAELEALPGIGPALAQRILEYRETHGPFTRVDELLQVKGIGPAKLEQLRPYVYVSNAP